MAIKASFTITLMKVPDIEKDYYNKAQTEAAIKVGTDNITSYVSKTYATKEDVDDAIGQTNTTLSKQITEETTKVQSTCESIILEATKELVATGDFAAYKETVAAELAVLAESITLNFTTVTQNLENVNKSLQDQLNTVTKYFSFDVNGLTIGKTDSPYKVIIDNDRYSMTVNDVEVMWIADGKVHTPEIEITKAMQLLGLVIDKDEAGNVNIE